ncbi:dienelactone hydrolase family protein [Massilia orientalis]|jgi:dienelactone hydrolase|uniref:Dienelactone hydrolase family protein n=1 Tax=Massilia orientalis TaxID=3050128 RepID=A0ACC7M5M2_9BURK|nr:dienelactone hydrolase family protein [Massilia sp. YIM B02787]
MAHIVLFHSSLGLRTVEREAAARLEDWGHRVTLPDLYAGRAADATDPGLALMDEIGWTTICERARSALADVPDTAVLFGVSMGAGVIGAIWPERLAARAIILLHGLATIPAHVKPATPVAVHVADPDPFIPHGETERWQARAAAAGMLATIVVYPGAGHFFTDPALPDFSPAAKEATWAGLASFLERLD